jgi:hypothetical protein
VEVFYRKESHHWHFSVKLMISKNLMYLSGGFWAARGLIFGCDDKSSCFLQTSPIDDML